MILKVNLALKADKETQRIINSISKSYMEFVSECKKSYNKEETGKIVGLVSPVIEMVEFFFDKEGNWRE
jgi:hypothetical protein